MEETFNRIKFIDAIVGKKDWKTNLSSDLLNDNFEEDKKLYVTDKDREDFVTRRFITLFYLHRPGWEKTVNMACWEAISRKSDKVTKQFQKNGLHDSLNDFIEHIFNFETVREIMRKRVDFDIISENPSTVHDVDKLHPIMLAGYAEKFQDGKDTSLWKACLQNHIRINPHHQDNALWQGGNCNESLLPRDSCSHCDQLRNYALAEMICDKVSRKLQKEHNGVVSDEMWNVNPKYFDGLPTAWLDKAYKIIDELKRDYTAEGQS